MKHFPVFCRDHNFSAATAYRLLASRQIKAVKRGRFAFVVMASYREYVANLKPFVSHDSRARELIGAAKLAGARRPPGTRRPKKAMRKTRAKAA